VVYIRTMSILLFIYIFAIFVLLSPSILFKTHLLIHSLCFALIIYFTHNLVLLSGKENMKALKTEQSDINDHELNVSFSNNTRRSEKSNILGQMMIEAFERVAELKTNIQKLKTMIKAYSGTTEELAELKKLFYETTGKLTQLEEKLIKFNDMEKEFKDLNNNINSLEVEKKDLQNQVNKCKTEFANSEIIISDNNTKNSNLQEDISSSVTKTAELNTTINSYNSKIPSKTDEMRNKISTCALQYLKNSVSWIQEYI